MCVRRGMCTREGCVRYERECLRMDIGRVVEKEREVHDTVTTPVSVSHEGWCAIKDDDTVCEVGGHDEIVFHYKGCLLGMQNESVCVRVCQCVHGCEGLQSVTNLLMTLAAAIRCSESRYAEGSSIR